MCPLLCFCESFFCFDVFSCHIIDSAKEKVCVESNLSIPANIFMLVTHCNRLSNHLDRISEPIEFNKSDSCFVQQVFGKCQR